MNQHLQTILNTIQQDESLSAEQKNAITKSLKDVDKELEITAFKLDRTEKVKRTTAILLEETIEELEQKRKAVETQNKELAIEAALERVRAKTMAMQKSDELNQVVSVVFEQLLQLGFPSDGCAIVLYNKENLSSEYWMAIPDNALPQSFTIPYFDHQYYKEELAAWQKGIPYQTFVYEGELKKSFELFVLNHSPLASLPDDVKKVLTASERAVASIAFMDYGSLSVIGPEPLSDDDAAILKRFTKVFDQTYTRFLDLQKAEAQAREAKIEAALERVRSRTMAMHKSEELSDAAYVLFQQFNALGEDPLHFSIGIFKEDEGVIEFSATLQGNQMSQAVAMPVTEPHVMNKLYQAWKEQKKSLVIELAGKELQEYVRYRHEITGISAGDIEITGRRIVNAAFFSKGLMSFSTLEPRPQESIQLLEKFAGVFDLTYTRFLDLQKAEAQARESQIQLAMERVRARTMAMYKSDEITEVVKLVYQEFEKLKINTESTDIEIGLIDEDTGIASIWAHFYQSDGTISTFKFPFNHFPVIRDEYKTWKATPIDKRKHLFITNVFSNEIWQEFLDLADKMPDIQEIFRPLKEANISQWVSHNAYFSHGLITLQGVEAYSPETQDILKRFAVVFEQTYTRFHDLQNAEAQAREAQIEAALERVRARTMAMQKSEELSETAAVLFQQFKELGEVPMQISIGTINEAEGTIEMRVTDWSGSGSQVNRAFTLSLEEPTLISKEFKAWKEHKSSIVIDLTGKELENWITYRNRIYGIPVRAEDIKGRRVVSCAFFSRGLLNISTPEPRPQETIQLLERFAGVFDLTYTRFLDLQKAEEQAKEAMIEAALERVRGKAMAMHSSEDLAETIKAFYQQMGLLNLMPRRCGVGLIDKETHIADLTGMIISDSGEAKEISGKLKLAEHPVLKKVYDSWLLQTEYHPVLRGNEIKEYYQFIGSRIAFQNYPHDAVQFGYFFFFTEGTVYAWTEKKFTEDELKIYRRFTSVLSLTYKRYKDLKEAEAQAREAKIEAALERVRTQTMAMNKSQDLQQVVSIIFRELDKLELKTLRCGIGIMNADSRSVDVWTTTTTNEGYEVNFSGNESMDVHPMLQGVFAAWEKQEDFYYTLQGEDLISYYNTMSGDNYKLPDAAAGASVSDRDCQYYYCTFFVSGGIYFFREIPFTEDIIKVIRRFANAFSLAYKRFEDLKQSEARALEAIKESSLDRVRAEIASMRTTDDLQRITPIIWQELMMLEVPFFRCGVFIIDEINTEVKIYLSAPDGHSLGVMNVPFNANSVTANSVDHWRRGLVYTEHWDKEAFV
ncbi:MAG: hypothetical protein M3352_08180, partial [Bacteroidota bacterium]|nr:hypothetical protein [Bacteroidota bacterium]